MELPKDKSVVFEKMKMGIKSHSMWNFYFYSDIIKIITDANYTIVCLMDKVYYVDTRLKIFEELLPTVFFRCNRSSIINLAYMESIEHKNKKIKIILSNGDEYNVSRALKNTFFTRIKRLKTIIFPCEQCLFCTKKDRCQDFEPFMK